MSVSALSLCSVSIETSHNPTNPINFGTIRSGLQQLRAFELNDNLFTSPSRLSLNPAYAAARSFNDEYPSGVTARVRRPMGTLIVGCFEREQLQLTGKREHKRPQPTTTMTSLTCQDNW